MTQIGLGFGQLIQQGIGRGWDNYRADQQMAMQRQAMEEQRPMQALRMQALQQELEQRRLAAQQLLEQEDADRQVFEQDWTTGVAATAASRASPRVQDMLVRYKSDRMAYVNRRGELAKTLAAAKAAGLSKALPEGFWDDALEYGIEGLSPDDMPDSIRERMTNRSENTKLAQVDLMTIAESDGSVGPPSVDVDRREWLASKPAEVVDMIFRQQWLPKQKARREQQAAEAQQKALAEAYRVLYDPNATPEQRSQSQAVIAQMNAPMGGAGRATAVDPAEFAQRVADVMRLNPTADRAAAEAFVRARYAGLVNQESANISGARKFPSVTQSTVTLRTEDGDEKEVSVFNGGGRPLEWLDGNQIVESFRATAKKLALGRDAGKYDKDGWFASESEDAYKARVDNMAKEIAQQFGWSVNSGGGVPNPAQPAQPSSQRPSPSFPAATYGTAANDPAPGGETPRDFGEAYAAVADGTAEGPDAMVDRFLSENQNAHNQYDLDPLIERMLDAGVSGDEIKRALTAKGFKP